MVKDLQYFINAENEFCKEHPNYGELFFDTSIGEMSEQGINDRLNYLSDRIISKYNCKTDCNCIFLVHNICF